MFSAAVDLDKLMITITIIFFPKHITKYNNKKFFLFIYQHVLFNFYLYFFYRHIFMFNNVVFVRLVVINTDRGRFCASLLSTIFQLNQLNHTRLTYLLPIIIVSYGLIFKHGNVRLMRNNQRYNVGNLQAT